MYLFTDFHVIMFGMSVLSPNQINMLVDVYFFFHELVWATNLNSPNKKNCVAINSNPPIYVSTVTYWEQIIRVNRLCYNNNI